ncbi:MAG: YraN family protein [Betaproteobacteria bacterium]|nr:YraN family protein [Betaproteobacteria bacterium]
MKDECIFERRDGLSKHPGSTALLRGKQGEDLAARFLEQRGLHILARNYRCRQGEVDLVARDGTTLVFVEVRWRGGQRFGGAVESIDIRKRRRLVAAARHYLGVSGVTLACRFDAILIQGNEDVVLEWVRDACWT